MIPENTFIEPVFAYRDAPNGDRLSLRNARLSRNILTKTVSKETFEIAMALIENLPPHMKRGFGYYMLPRDIAGSYKGKPVLWRGFIFPLPSFQPEN